LLLVEAKANIEEIKSKCEATSDRSIEKMRKAFVDVKRKLGVPEPPDWMQGYYQAANRIATLHFILEVNKRRVPARLLFIYFVGDVGDDGRTCPQTDDEWRPALREQDGHLGLSTDHALADRVHKLFLPVCEQA